MVCASCGLHNSAPSPVLCPYCGAVYGVTPPTPVQGTLDLGDSWDGPTPVLIPEIKRPTCWKCRVELCEELDRPRFKDDDEGLCGNCRAGRKGHTKSPELLW